MKIGMLGGTFNPIHSAHVRMAELARDALALDLVLMMVDADPPHKAVDGGVSASHRLIMTRLAVEHTARVEACALEIERGGKSYTADTLAHLRELYPDAELYLIVGSDMLLDLPSWYHPERVAALAHILAVARVGQAEGDEAAAEALRQTYHARVTLLTGRVDAFSSTNVRDRLEAGLPVSDMLCPAVERYCYETGLYFPLEVRRMQNKCRAALDEKRYVHTMGVVRAASALAARWDVDPSLSRTAALLHDCAKRLDPVTLAVYGGDDTGILSVLHAFAGAVVAHNEYGVSDQRVLRAIRLHSTGDAGMTALDALVYLADLTEPNRAYPGVEDMRESLSLGPARAMLGALRLTKAHVESLCTSGRETAFHPAGDRAIRYYLQQTNEQETEETN